MRSIPKKDLVNVTLDQQDRKASNRGGWLLSPQGLLDAQHFSKNKTLV